MAGVITAWRQWTEFIRAHRIYKERAKQTSKQRKLDLLRQAQQAADKGNAHELWKTARTLAPKAPRKRLQLRREGHMTMITPEEELSYRRHQGPYSIPLPSTCGFQPGSPGT